MEPIIFDLPDGYFDPDTKQTHKQVVMRGLTMRDQIEISKDARVKDILATRYSLSSDNTVEQMMALTAFQQYHLIIFGRVVERIGDLDQTQIRAKQVLEALSIRDINLMMNRHMGAGSEGAKLISMDLVETVIDDEVASADLRRTLKKSLLAKLGEPQPAITA